jgi:hypothetical protein
MIVGAYRDFFAALAATAGSLTGLLFVAISVSPRRGPEAGPPVIQQVRAAAALLAFVNTLAVALFGLVPDSNVRYPAITLGIIGLLFTAAGTRSIFSSAATTAQQTRQLGLIFLLIAIFGSELVCGLVLMFHPDRGDPVSYISYALVTSLLVGIARAWELVGDRDTGIAASITELTRHRHGQPAADRPAAEAAAAEASVASGPEPGDQEPGDRAR